jgi:hypothetical protein
MDDGEGEIHDDGFCFGSTRHVCVKVYEPGCPVSEEMQLVPCSTLLNTVPICQEAVCGQSEWDDCEVKNINECESCGTGKNCKNGACVVRPTSDCKPLCDPNPCFNGGDCLVIFSLDKRIPNAFDCICPDGWTGDLCELSTNPCLSRPCQHGKE